MNAILPIIFVCIFFTSLFSQTKSQEIPEKSLMFFASPLAPNLRPAGFTSVNFDLGLHYKYRIFTIDGMYETALNDIFPDAYKTAEIKRTVTRKSVNTFYRSAELGGGVIFFKKRNQEDSRMNFYQVHAGYKTLDVPDITNRLDTLIPDPDGPINKTKYGDVTLNTDIGILYAGLEIIRQKYGASLHRTFRIYTDVLYAAYGTYSATKNDGSSFTGNTNAIMLQRMGGRIGVESTLDLPVGFRWLIEMGIRPGVHEVNATFAPASYNTVQYSVYNLYVSAKIGICSFWL